MEKLRVTLEDLQVQSFTTSGPDFRMRGTVRAHAPTDPVECLTGDDPWNTCHDSCDPDRCAPQNDWTIPCTDNCNDTNYGFCSGSRG
ncbi:MAG TPA: hypothetical protein VM759_13495 [Longimicrobium sp.]|nr:hypothetical protein [Longimicrobium sp.]